jgi:hypothetical protein
MIACSKRGAFPRSGRKDAIVAHLLLRKGDVSPQTGESTEGEELIREASALAERSNNSVMLGRDKLSLGN